MGKISFSKENSAFGVEIYPAIPLTVVRKEFAHSFCVMAYIGVSYLRYKILVEKVLSPLCTFQK